LSELIFVAVGLCVDGAMGFATIGFATIGLAMIGFAMIGFATTIADAGAGVEEPFEIESLTTGWTGFGASGGL